MNRDDLYLLAKEKYKLFAIAWRTNEKLYGNDYRDCVTYILGLLVRLSEHWHVDLRQALDSYYRFVEKQIRIHNSFLKEGRYRFECLADLEKSDEWQAHQKDYGFILLFSIIFSSHRFEIYHHFRKMISAYARKGGKCLEVGAGCGVETSFLAKYFDVKAYDMNAFSREAINFLFPELQGKFFPQVYDFSEKGYYDVAVMIELIEHVENPLELLSGFSSVLTNSGVGFLTFALNMPQIDHIYHFRNIVEVTTMLQSSGLTVIKDFCAVSSALPIPFQKREEYASDMRFPTNYCCLVKKVT